MLLSEVVVVEEEEEIMSSTVTTTTTTTTTVFLPPEIIMEILSRLPASSLVSSFKLVCKPWRNLIKDPDFVKMHLLNRGGAINGGGGGGGEGASITTANSSLICKYGKDLFQFHPPFNFESGKDLFPAAAAGAATKLDFDSLSLNSRLVGSCNGLLCLNFDADDDENIILLNPSTRKYKISPKQPIKYPTTRQYPTPRGEAIYGFGCCSTTNNNIYDDEYEYKVVRIVYSYGIDQGEHSSRSQIDIYSMSSNSWRRTTDTKTTIDYTFTISSKQSGVFVNEALHWVAAPLRGHWDTIVSFDIRDEEFRQVPSPLPCAYESYFSVGQVILMNMKGCLSMIRFPHGRRNVVMEAEAAADLEIWVMKEYGIKESWTKEFVISSGDTDPPRALSEFKISWRPNAYVLKGDQMLIEGLTNTKEGHRRRRLSWEGFRKLVLYDINKRKIINGDFKMIGVPVEPNVPYPRIDLVDYIETLVSLKSSIIVHALDSNLSSSSS